MVAPVAKYLFQSYCSLYSAFGYGNFDFQKAVKVLNHDEKYTGQIISKLENDGWIQKSQELSDARKKIYRLNNIEKIVEKIGRNNK
jgi:DNA-binding MarR family transcriptional regulator